MTVTCDSTTRLSLGAYVLGALDPVERADVDAHLAGCESCRDELAGIAAMPGLLARVRLEDVLEPEPSPTPAMAERLIGRLRTARRDRRRRRLAFAAGAIAVAAVTAGTIAITTGGGGTGAPPNQVASVAAGNSRTGVAATFALRPASWGTAIRVRLRGVPAGTNCRLIALGRDGRREVAGTWRATYDGTADVQTATAIPKRELASLAVTTTQGRMLVRAPL